MAPPPLTELDDAILQLVTTFVGRQHLARDVLVARRPDFFSSQRRAPDRAYVRAVSHGRWGEDEAWTYRIHGHGCTMKNETTGEPVRWVSPDLERFDPYWLAEWIAWRLERGEEDAAAAVVRDRLDVEGVALEPLVLRCLERLADAKRLRRHADTTNMYELLPRLQARRRRS